MYRRKTTKLALLKGMEVKLTPSNGGSLRVPRSLSILGHLNPESVKEANSE
jgi:hypothetical protein